MRLDTQQFFMMLLSSDKQTLTAHHRNLSVLVLHLLLLHFWRGQCHLITPSQPIMATPGDDIILPCQLDPAQDAVDRTVEWTRPDLNPRFVHVRRSMEELIDNQHQVFKGRTSLFINELKHGNVSLKLSKVKLSDNGTYRCFIPEWDKEAFVHVFVASAPSSSPVITLAATDEGVMLQCDSNSLHPQPEVSWLDAERNFLSAGPTETVRGPDDLYTVSSRVTVKRHNNTFTCRVQQKDINQTRETHIHVPDDFFKIQSRSSPATVGLVVSLTVCIIFILCLVFIVLKQRHNIFKTKRSQCDETDEGEMQHLRKHLITKRSEQQRKQEDEDTVKSLKETMKNQVRDKITELLQLFVGIDKEELQTLNEELENKNQELEKIRDELSRYLKFSLDPRRSELKKKKEEVEQEVETLKKKVETKKTEIQTKTEQFVEKQADLLQQLQVDSQKMETFLQKLEQELQNMTEKNQNQNQNLESNEKQSPGVIISLDVDQQGRFIRLMNQSTEVQQLKNWEIHVRVNDRKPNFYRFWDQTKLQVGKCVTVWTKGGISVETYTDQMWSDQEPWKPEDKVLVSVFNSSGELVTNKEQEGQRPTTNQDSTSRPVIVHEVDQMGRYIKLHNKSDQDQQLKGWEVHIQVNNRRPIIKKLKQFNLRPGQTETVTYEVGKKHKLWDIGDQVLITLFNREGEEVDVKTFDVAEVQS